MLYFNFNTTKTINHFSLKKLFTNFNYSDYFNEQNKQDIRKKATQLLTLRKL